MKLTLNYLHFLALIGLSVLFSCKELDPSVSFIASSNQANVGVELSFSNSSVNCATYEWDFGDGTKSTDENPKKTYTKAGKYTVTLKGITKKEKKEQSKSLEITINSISEFIKGSIDGVEFDLNLDNSDVTAAFSNDKSLGGSPNYGTFGYGFSKAGKEYNMHFGRINFSGSEPDSNSFKSMFSVGNVTLNSLDSDMLGVSITYYDGAGNLYSSIGTDQTGSTVNITEMRGSVNLSGQDIVIVKATFNCKVKNSSTGIIKTITNGSFHGRFDRHI